MKVGGGGDMVLCKKKKEKEEEEGLCSHRQASPEIFTFAAQRLLLCSPGAGEVSSLRFYLVNPVFTAPFFTRCKIFNASSYSNSSTVR